MVDIEKIHPGTPVAGPYSPGIKVGNLLFISGQGPAQGTTDIFLKDMKNFGKMNRAYRKFFEDNGVSERFPARTTIEVSDLPVPSMLLEINAIAAL
ncbi:MAG: RidA family protein [Promethearchaeota archaeon]